MNVSLKLATLDEAQLLWEMQKKAFQETYERYRDEETSPYLEPLEKTVARLMQKETFYYVILADDAPVGGLRVVDYKDERAKRISPIFILPEYKNKGIGQTAIRLAENLHGKTIWMLSTIRQEAGNCHLYEKMGYVRSGAEQAVNDRMTLIFYNK